MIRTIGGANASSLQTIFGLNENTMFWHPAVKPEQLLQMINAVCHAPNSIVLLPMCNRIDLGFSLRATRRHVAIVAVRSSRPQPAVENYGRSAWTQARTIAFERAYRLVFSPDP